jgi:PhnB protein
VNTVAERDAIERLDEVIGAILAGRRVTPVIDSDLATLAAVAADLRELPRPEFKSQLRRQLMPNVTVREEFQTMTPYFVVDGADRVIQFMRDAFGADVRARFARPDGTVMHAAVKIGDSMIELGDGGEKYPPAAMAIHVYVDDADAVYAQAIAAGGTSLRPMTDQFYGDREGSVTDPAGNFWYIATHKATGSKPPGFRTITPFVHVRGVDRLMEFMKNAFGAVELSRFAPENLVVHAVMRIGNSLIEMGEGAGEWKPKPAHVHLFVSDADAVYARALKAGATVLYPIADQPYGERSGGVTDPFGNQWFIATPK